MWEVWQTLGTYLCSGCQLQSTKPRERQRERETELTAACESDGWWNKGRLVDCCIEYRWMYGLKRIITQELKYMNKHLDKTKNPNKGLL